MTDAETAKMHEELELVAERVEGGLYSKRAMLDYFLAMPPDRACDALLALTAARADERAKVATWLDEKAGGVKGADMRTRRYVGTVLEYLADELRRPAPPAGGTNG